MPSFMKLFAIVRFPVAGIFEESHMRVDVSPNECASASDEKEREGKFATIVHEIFYRWPTALETCFLVSLWNRCFEIARFRLIFATAAYLMIPMDISGHLLHLMLIVRVTVLSSLMSLYK